MKNNWFRTKVELIRKRLETHRWVIRLQQIPFPWTGGASVFEVIRFFYLRLISEAITMRAAAIAFSFFLALFPALIFLFTLIPYIPVKDLQPEMMSFFRDVLPENAYQAIESTLSDILLTRRGSLLSFGFIASLYFASNGVNSLLQAFNPVIKRKLISRYINSITLTFALVMLIITALTIQVAGELMYASLTSYPIFNGIFASIIFDGFRILIIFMLILSGISVLYHYGLVRKERFSFFSPGAFLATIYIAITSLGFAYYVEHFGRYNKLYGSIGALIVLMMWIYLNAIGLLTGYEFNRSMKMARDKVKFNQRNSFNERT